MQRIVVFSSWRTGVPAVLTAALRDAVAARDDCELAGVCLPCAPPRFGPARSVPNRISAWLNRERRPLRAIAPISPRRWSRRYGVRFLYPENGDFNAPGFVARLLDAFSPTLLLSVFCLQKLGPALLESVAEAVNYHNGALPAYRGLRATGWSIYNGDSQSGFCFHRMTAELDAGEVLIAGSVPIAPRDWSAHVEADKAHAAAARLPELLGLLAEGTPGESQRGAATYYGRADFDAITRIEQPSSLSREELLRRLRAFRVLHLRLGGRWYSVDLLEERARGGRRGSLCFRTADGAWLAPTRIRSLPVPLYRVRSLLPG